jgi:hypothetical protein
MSKPRILADSNAPNSELVKNALNAGGDAPIYACRAWVNFDGDTVTIRGSGNVSSVSRSATGVYTVNFTTAMPDVNYVVTGIAHSPSALNGTLQCPASDSTNQATGFVAVGALQLYAQAAFNPVFVQVSIFR